jgi:Rieske Fe-S protein
MKKNDAPTACMGWMSHMYGTSRTMYCTEFQAEVSPASVNLKIPPYSFEGDNKLIIGVDAPAKGVA